jgi:hypothetical protein
VGDAGVVDEDIKALELASEDAEQIVDRLRIAHLTGVHEDLNLCRSQFPADAAQGLLIAAGYNQIATFGGQRAGDGQSHAAGGAGD